MAKMCILEILYFILKLYKLGENWPTTGLNTSVQSVSAKFHWLGFINIQIRHKFRLYGISQQLNFLVGRFALKKYEIIQKLRGA